jgi:radical SAM protein with 4Fe4S-binding SPASM domain
MAILEITNRCNLECVHCVRESPTVEFSDELTTPEWLNVLDELAALGVFSVCFSGGEATIHPDFFALVDRARECKMAVFLKTNGLSLGHLAPRLAAAGVRGIDVSLYGATSGTHERCTKIARSFERTVDSIRAARAADITVTIKVSLFRWNVHELEAIRSLGRELGCSVQRDYLLTNTDTGRVHDEDLCTPAQMRWVESVWPSLTLPEALNGPNRIKICNQGVSRLAVTARGEILSCIAIRKPIGHVRAGGIHAAWESARERPHEIAYERFDRCLSCDWLDRCRVCLGHNDAATGSWYEPPLERCMATMALFGRTHDAARPEPVVPRQARDERRNPAHGEPVEPQAHHARTAR